MNPLLTYSFTYFIISIVTQPDFACNTLLIRLESIFNDSIALRTSVLLDLAHETINSNV